MLKYHLITTRTAGE